jgi:hypothetical protein
MIRWHVAPKLLLQFEMYKFIYWLVGRLQNVIII